MTSPYIDLIEKERAKIEVLRTAIASCESRIAVLESMVGGDDLDRLLEMRVGDVKKQQSSLDLEVASPSGHAYSSVDEQRVSGEVTQEAADAKAHEFPRRALDPKSVKMLRFAGEDDKSISDFLAFAKANSISTERQRVRAFLNLYKSKYGLLESSQDGYFHLSELGTAYLKSLGDGRSGGETRAVDEGTKPTTGEAPTSAT